MKIGKFLEANGSLDGGRRERRFFLFPPEWGRRAAGRGFRSGDDRRAAAVRAPEPAAGAGLRWMSGTPLF